MIRTFLLVIIGSVGVWGQVYDQGAPDAEPNDAQAYDPTRGVARISVMEGEVSVGRGEANEVVAAALNAPLMTQDRVLTGPESRAEVQLDRENILRVGSRSEVRFAGLEYGRFQIQVATGTVTLTVLGQPQTQGEIDTPSISVRATAAGAYRITVREDGSSEITVRSGAAEIYTPSGTEQLQPGQTMIARGPASDPEFQMVDAISMDAWDEWNLRRDQQLREAQQQAYQYVSPEITGAEDLEGNGQWVNEQPYGYVWSPNVAADWAPYRYGRWVWEDWYGWTWVSYDPWGWAPYHYGRWFWGSRGWCWYPGSMHARYYWSPALVGFFGFGHGSGFGVGFGFGNVGWVPLAPYERFHPWWGRGYREGWGGYRRDGFVSNTNIYNSYRNARFANGITAVNASDFGRRGFNGNYVRADRAELARASVVRGPLPFTPTRESYRMSDRQVQMGRLPQVRNTQFAGGRMQAGGFQRGGGFQNSGGFQRGVAQPAPSGHGGGGWGRFGEPIHSGPATTNGYRGGATNGWQRFNPQQQQMNNGGSRVWNASPAPARTAPRMYSPGASQPVRIAPPIVNNRSTTSDAYGWRGGSVAPRAYTPPASTYSAPRSFGAPPPNYSRSYSAPSYTPRAYAPPAARSYEAPRSYGPPAGYAPRSYSPPPARSYEAPRSYSPPPTRSYEAPRSYSPPPARSYEAPRSFSAPSRSYEAPRSYSPPARSYGGGGGGGYSRSYSAPSGSGGGGHSSGGGGGHGGGGRGDHHR